MLYIPVFLNARAIEPKDVDSRSRLSLANDINAAVDPGQVSVHTQVPNGEVDCSRRDPRQCLEGLIAARKHRWGVLDIVFSHVVE